MAKDLLGGLTADRSTRFGSAVSLAIAVALSGCSNPSNPAPNAVGAATPPQPVSQQRQPPSQAGDNVFATTPGDGVQSPGNYVPIGSSPYRGN